MRAAMVVAMFALLGCAADTMGPEDVKPTNDPCGNDVPLVSWQTFGEGFTATYCQGCHASETPERQGAPDHIIFDTEADAVSFSTAILATAVGDEPRMPPNGGPTQDDRELLSIWLTCFAEE